MTERTLGIGLFVSIVLNVFLAAAFISALSLAGYVAHHPAAPIMRHAAHSLDRAHRAEFIAVLRGQGAAVRPLNRQARSLRLGVWRAMQGADFDPAAAKLALAQARTQSTAARAQVENAVIDFAAKLPTDQRAAFGRALERAAPRGRGAGSHAPAQQVQGSKSAP